MSLIGLSFSRRRRSTLVAVAVVELLMVMMLVIIVVPILGFSPSSSSSPPPPPSGASSLGQSTISQHQNVNNGPRPHSSRLLLFAERSSIPSSREYNDGDDDYYYYTDDDNDKNNYYEDEDDDEDGEYWGEDKNGPRGPSSNKNKKNEEDKIRPPPTRGGMYKVVFDPSTEIDPKETQLDWEVCYSDDDENRKEALVLLPPEAVTRPTAILHFVGGTFFGSLPQVWYRSLLEGLVRNTQCAIVVTPIPVTLLKSPLQHVSLSRKLRSAFENAWTTVLEDEYGADVLKDIPLCGCGHSLGGRLMVVLTTLTQNKQQQQSKSKTKSRSTSNIPPYKSFVLISFTNYGAAAGIPGVSTLLRQSKKQERDSQTTRERSRRKRARKEREDWWIDDGDKYNEEDNDEEWEELVEDLQELLKEQAARVKSALTPDSKDLEFSPSPDMLWKALEKDGRYRVPKTLIVQFDDDTIDQSSKLAQILHSTNSSDVHFARLRGVHLTPVSVEDGSDSSSSSGGWLGLSSRTTTAVWKAIKGRGKTRAQETAMRDLRQSISRYISDVVTK